MHSSRFEYEICLISIVQPTNRIKHKTKQNKKNQTHKPIQSQKTIKLRSFLTVLLEIQYRNQNRKELRETKLSLIFHACFSATKQWTVGTKQLTFFFSFERLHRLKPCYGLIKSFGKGDACEIVETDSGDWEWDWVREQWDGEKGEWGREWREWVTWISVRVRWWVRAWGCVSALCERGWVRVESDLCEVRCYFWK